MHEASLWICSFLIPGIINPDESYKLHLIALVNHVLMIGELFCDGFHSARGQNDSFNFLSTVQ